MHNNYTYIFVMVLVTYSLRVLPLTLIRQQITHPFVRAFLYYVPYVTLSVMTFPAIILATDNPIAGMAAFVIGVIFAWYKHNLLTVAVVCCVTVYLADFLLAMM
ncbi:Branched-chain amino acid transport protein (AzlD) [Granulicatella balaenopterae]|uniref:Branched-chain amino acid transport protein (AzlD) n=1 Tax=Granulicatella balaenopterae TaxID=137733 RepID=A0A1H9P084_9LACT|nr:AzlD domain-containing protein [Granulicatella balaenopterae]SER41602.1 Branched-chain amino acid transport protein (AzlD) [Granulicatella balaenopterae]